jgi:hypothetical protein
VYVTLIKDPEHNVDRHERGQDQERLVGQRGLESLSRTLEAAPDAGGQPDLTRGRIDRLDGLPERYPGCQVEGDCRCGKLTLPADDEGPGRFSGLSNRAQRHLSTGRTSEIDRL